MINTKLRYLKCPSCFFPTVRLKGDRYFEHAHHTINVGRWCPRCKILFFNPDFVQSVTKDNVKYYNSETLPFSYGWVKFKNGLKRPGTRVHFILNGEKKSLCGYLKLWDFELQHLVFMTADQFPASQQCERCAKRLPNILSKTSIIPMVFNK